MNDPYDLQRFLTAQQVVYEVARTELRAGRKQTHWMWFIFPQIKGLGHSPMAIRYAISSLEEARAYLAHPVLGPRLRECSQIVADLDDTSVDIIFGHPDDLKFRSSMTLFSHATSDNKVFVDCLRKYFGGEADRATLARL